MSSVPDLTANSREGIVAVIGDCKTCTVTRGVI